LQRCGATCVFHTASPHIGAPPEIHHKVSVEGTKVVVEACQQLGVKKLVYTSTAGVTFDGSDNINIDERFEHFDRYPDAYMVTKVRLGSRATRPVWLMRVQSAAEKLVLAANGQKGLLTCAIRPANIFG
jgi:sterol-4alpha-carboxylate 3-dehydrogenase (decarboxylating)